MARASGFEKTVSIDCEPSAVYAELIEPERQIGLQPLLVAVGEVDVADRDRSRAFEAVERVPILGPIHWRNRIQVRITLTRPGEIVDFEAQSAPGVTVRSRFTLERVADGTVVIERVELEAPVLLRGFVRSQAERAQVRLLANLKRRLESAPEDG